MQNVRKIAYGAANGLLLLAPAIASAQAPVLPGGGGWTGRGNPNAAASELKGTSIYDIIAATLGWLLAILGFIAVMGFVISGILYLTAAGNETQIEKAKNAMTYSIIGVIVALMGYVIITAVSAWLGGSAGF